jgi:glycosyltransferase involved in cell wall biosynthesis
MNILIISFSVNGAMGDNFKLVVNYLSKKAHVTVFTNNKIKFSEISEKQIYRFSFDRKQISDFINPVTYYRLYSLIKKTNYDIAFFLSFHPVNLFLYKFIDKNKTVFYMHDHEPHDGLAGIDLYFLKKQLKIVYSKSRKIIVSSNYMKNEILQKKYVIDASKIEVIYLGALENLQFSLTKKEEDIDILFFGRIEYYKGLDILISAYPYLKNSPLCLLVGKGNLKTIFGINTLPSEVKHINNYVSDHDLAKFIQRSKIIVMPYRNATGTQVIQTAFYYEKPVIASDTGCFSEYISSGHDGIIVQQENPAELANAINYLLSNPVTGKKFGENGKKKLDNIFSNKNITEQYMNIFNNLIS